MRTFAILWACMILVASCKNKTANKQEIIPAVPEKEPVSQKEDLKITPIEHASFIMEWTGKTIAVDPVGGEESYTTAPDLVLVTDVHPDHLDAKTLAGLVTDSMVLIAPKAVRNSLPDSLKIKTTTMDNGDTLTVAGIKIRAIPMYNLREEAKDMHIKGRGNGYVLEMGQKRIYIAGDTEDIPEMRNLKNIDIAFIPMNLPYTMPVEAAADAVLDFKPKKVYPYHYKGKNGLSNVAKFKNLVETNSEEIEVVQLDWYPE